MELSVKPIGIIMSVCKISTTNRSLRAAGASSPFKAYNSRLNGTLLPGHYYELWTSDFKLDRRTTNGYTTQITDRVLFT